MKKLIILLCFFLLMGCSNAADQTVQRIEIPDFDGENYSMIINDNKPLFTEEEIVFESFESYSELDKLGRCQVATACLSADTMPKEDETREDISQIDPSGFNNTRYTGGYLYNRCHLIMWALSDENDNELNLITGTVYFNTDEENGMLKYETMVLDYIKETGNHVMYRVTPYYNEDDLVAKGVLMEALSLEDEGKGISFCVFIYNEQPGIVIDHSDGSSYLDLDYEETESIEGEKREISKNITYIINTNTNRFHDPSCSSVLDMKEKNKKESSETREALIEQGYIPCGNCNP